MKSWRVSDIGWANESDLKLPFWQKWNQSNHLPDGFWQRIWEYPYVASKIPRSGKVLDIGGTYPFVLFKNFPRAVSVDCRNLNKLKHPLHLNKWPRQKLIICDAARIPVNSNSINYVFSISAIEEMPHMFKVLKEMIRIAKYRVVVTMDVSDSMGVPVKKLRELEEFLGCKIPRLPFDALTSESDILTQYKQNKLPEFKHIRVLSFTLDSTDQPKSVGILVPHWNSWPFLKISLKYIQKNRNRTLKETVYVLDDSSTDGSLEKAKAYFKKDRNIQFHCFHRPNKQQEPDVGLLLDYGLKLLQEQYVAAIDADLFPLTKDWLAFPIWLIEKYHCSSVGVDTGLSNAYCHQLKSDNWWQPDKGYVPNAGLYDNSWFTCINNFYRVMPGALAKVVSENIGFTRATPQTKFQKLIRKIYNPRLPYLPGGEDNGVAANHFMDINRLGPKFNLPLTSYIGLTLKDGAFGQNISGLAFHFALSTRALSGERREVGNAGKSFKYWSDRLQKAKTINDKILKQMVAKSRRFQSGGYDGSIPVSWYKKEFSYIQKLLEQYKRSHRAS